MSYKIGSGKFSSDNLSIKFQLGRTEVTWNPEIIKTGDKGVSSFFDKTIAAQFDGQMLTFDFDDDGQLRISPEENDEVYVGQYEQHGEYVHIQIGGEELLATYNGEVLEIGIPRIQRVTDPLNLKGTIRTLDGWNGGSLDNLEEGLLSRSGWALVDDSETNLFDGNPDWNWVVTRPEGNRQDWYFFGYGHEYKKCLMNFTKIAGKIPMPPKFAFGYWWSRYWAYSDSELKELMNDFSSTYNSLTEKLSSIDVCNEEQISNVTFGLSYSQDGKH